MINFPPVLDDATIDEMVNITYNIREYTDTLSDGTVVDIVVVDAVGNGFYDTNFGRMWSLKPAYITGMAENEDGYVDSTEIYSFGKATFGWFAEQCQGDPVLRL